MRKERESLLLNENERLRAAVEMLLVSKQQFDVVLAALNDFLRADEEAKAKFKATLRAIDRLGRDAMPSDGMVAQLEAENERLRKAYAQINGEVCKILGRALDYPRYVDDQATFPGATEADGVCVGDHVAESIAAEAAERIALLEAENDRLRKARDAAWNAAIEAAAEAADPDCERGICDAILELKKDATDAE